MVMEGGVPLEVNLSQESMDALASKLAEALTKGAAVGTEGATKEFAKLVKTMQKVMVQGAREASAAWSKNFKIDPSGLAGASTQAGKLIEELREIGRLGKAAKVSSSQLYSLGITGQADLGVEREKQRAITEMFKQNGKLRVVEEANAGRLQGIEQRKAADIAVREARVAGEMRLAVHKTLLKTVTIVERGIVSAITGTAKTVTSVVSRLASGTASVLGRMASGIGSIFHRHNDDFTAGLQGSLSKRERILMTSLNQENATVGRAMARQATQIAELRAASQRGIIGGVSRNLLAGIGGGFAAISALRSTFNVGSEFVRGLAVLQQQLGLTADQMINVRKVSILLGNDISLPGVSALDAAQAIQILTKQFGYLGAGAVEAATQAAKGTLQLSRATGASAEEAAGVIGSAVNVFKIAAKDAVDVADSIAVALSKAAGVSFTEFADSFTQGAAVFQQFVGPAESAKKVLDEFSTTLAVLARSGLTGETAGAGLKQFFLQGSRDTDAINSIVAQMVAKSGLTGKLFTDANGKARQFGTTVDILRKGLVGLTDAQRNSTLSTLFGSRSITIANALVNTTAEEYDKLRNAMYRQGAAAAIAAAQNTGLKGAIDAFKSVIETTQIVLYEKVSPVLGKITLQMAELANEVLFSNGAWALFRRAVLGAATAMGAILAARGAVQVIQLLGKAAQIALGPFGLLLISAGLLGAALSVMLDRSASLRETMKVLGSRFAEIGSKIKTALLPYLKLAGDFLDDTVIPAVDRLAEFLADHLLGAFDATVRFIENKAIPAVRSFAGFLQREVFPVVSRVANVIYDGFFTGLHAVIDFGQRVLPYLRPAIEGFKLLGSAIASAFGGDFSELGSGLGAAGSGILSTLSMIGSKILELLKPVGEKIWAWVRTTFSGDNLKHLAGGFLDFVEWLGKTIGTIVSSPTFIKAVAAIATAAVIVGARFIEGFAKGVISNLPALWRLLGDALQSGFISLVKAIAGNIGTAFLVALGAFVFGPKLIGLFRKGGEDAGGGFLAGIKSRMVEFRDTFTNNLTVVKLWGTAIGDAGRNFSILRNAGDSAFGALRASFTKLWADMKLAAEAGGTTVGKVLGSAIRGGVTVALAGLGGFMAGKAEGQGGGSGLMSAIMVGLGVGAINPIAGVVAGAAALIGASIGRASKAAQEAKDRMAALASSIKDVLIPRMKEGKTAAEAFAAALAGDDKESVGKSILAAFSPKARDQLLKMGVSVGAIEKAMTGGASARAALLKQLEKLQGEIGFDGPEKAAAWKELKKVFDEFDKTVVSTTRDQRLLNGALGERRQGGTYTKAMQEVTQSITEATEAHIALNDELTKDLPVPGLTAFQAAYDAAVLQFQGLGPEIAKAISLEGPVGAATRNQLKQQLGSNINKAIQAGIADGSIATQEQLTTRLNELLAQAGEGGGPTATEFLKSFGATLLPGLSGLLGRVSDVVGRELLENGEFFGIGYNSGIDVVDGIIQGIRDKEAQAVTAAKRIADAVAGALELSWMINSPSKVFRDMGQQLGAGLALGIQDSTSRAVRAAHGMAAAVTSMPGGRPADGSYGYGSSSVDNRVLNDNRQTNLYLPSGDPAANALMVANRQASPLWG